MNGDVEMLVKRAKAGERAAASELIDQFYGKMFAYFRRLSGSDADAADLTQKLFCKAWASLPSFTGAASFNTWLHAIAHHTYVDWRRRADRNDFQTDEWWQACEADGPSPFESAAEREAAHQLYAAVEQLEEDHRQVIHLHYYQSLTLQETAAALNVSASTVKYRLRHGLDALHARMSHKTYSLKGMP